jgi:hypothetical protein
MAKFDFVLASVIMSAVIGLGVPCAAQLNGVVSSSGTFQSRTGSTAESMTVEPGLLLMGPPVTGQPYSGELESEHTQTLSNGTHIDQKRDVSLTYRDSQGRTRTERLLFRSQLPGAGKQQEPRIIRIYDPVEGYSYTLDSQKHVAHRVAVQIFPEVPQKNSQQTQADATNAPAKPPLLARRPGIGAGGTGRPDIKRESLGTDMIEGVEAEGWRTTITTAVGVIGNDKPLTRVCDTWHSVELKTLQLSKCSDVRSGRSTMRLKNLDR